MTKPPSKAAQLRQAEKVLLSLLRTPKTRQGLVAAVKTKTISRHYVFGFLAEGRRTGEIVALQSGRQTTYQVSKPCVEEKPVASEYPSWLDPRSLPTSAARAVFVAGVVIKISGKEE